MRHRVTRGRWGAVASLGVAAITLAMTFGAQAASALSVPTGSPHWNIGKPDTIRDAGSDTTFFMMQRLSDLYMQAGLFGCQLSQTPTPNYSTCNTGGDISTTDTLDNYDRVEIMTGIDQIGSGEGQKQLCGNDSSPFPVDFARSSSAPSSSNCSTNDMVGLGYAKDGVPLVTFSGLEGPGTATGGSSPWTGQIVGPVAAGWLPGDPVTCDTGAAGSSTNTRNTVNGCSGVPFNDISNNDNGGGTSSTAWRLYCDTTSAKITDWAQLTNLTGVTPVGSGAPIAGHPLPIEIAAVNHNSGTEKTFAHFVDSNQTSGGSDLCTTTNTNKSLLVCAGNEALENNASQFGDCAAADFGVSDTTRSADQAAEIGSTLYFFSNGVFNSNIHARSLTLSDGTKAAAIKINTENGTAATTSPSGTLMTNTYPTARTLYNIYRTGASGVVNQGDPIRASVAGFLSWICDSNNLFTKSTDLNTGVNYNSEITTAVQTTFGFIRLNDLTATPNNSCQPVTVNAPVTDGNENGTTSVTSTSQGFAHVHVGDLITDGVTAGIPAGTHVTNVSGNTLTLSAATTAGSQSGVTFTFNIFDPNS